jgi:hypothetical protein
MGRPAAAQEADKKAGWNVLVKGLMQLDLVAWSQSSQEELSAVGAVPLNENRFLIRRGRVRLEATKNAYLASVEFDGNTIAGPSARLLSAQLQWTLPPGVGEPLLQVKAGLLRAPFGAEVPVSDGAKTFLESPATARAFFPGNYDGGVMAGGQWWHLRWSAALLNGTPVGDAQYKGRDPSKSFDFVGRVGFEISTDQELKLTAGVSYLQGRGFHAGLPATKDSLQWVDGNNDGIVQTTELQVIAGSAGTPSETFSRRGFSIDGTVQWCACVLGVTGNGKAVAELQVGQNLDRGIEYADPVAAGRSLRELGWQLAVVQDIGPYAQVGVRYDRYQADRDRSGVLGANLVPINPTYSTLSVLAAGRYDGATATLQYDHERNPLGRSDTGAVATRAADRVTLRLQVGF